MKNSAFLHLKSSTTLALLALLLASCALPQSAQQAAQARNAQATQAAYQVQTALARPTGTLTPMPTSTPTQTPVPPSATPLFSATPAIRVTARPGLELYTHPGTPGYVFQIDSRQWRADPTGQTANMAHQSFANCRIKAVPERETALPERRLIQDIGRFRWEILDYETWAYARPIAGASLVDNRGIYLMLQGYRQATCRSAQEDVLADLMTLGEAEGLVASARYASPTPRPALGGFECPGAPQARLRVGDEVMIVVGGLWLRSEPRVDNSTRVRQFLRYPPYQVRVIGGPSCETYVYWQVELSTLGEGSDALQGWLAEGDLQEYYLIPVR